jgi:hypothetical protein
VNDVINIGGGVVGPHPVEIPTQPKPGPNPTPQPAQTEDYRVLLPVEIGGELYEYGATANLDAATAKAYKDALVRVADAAGAAAAQAGEEAKTRKQEGK